MRNKNITATLLAIFSGGAMAFAQQPAATPRLIVNIAIDQLRTDYMESYEQLYGSTGFKKLILNGLLYTDAQFKFAPVDRASALAALSTGTTPNYNGIVGEKWFDRATLRPVSCVDDSGFHGFFTKENTSAQNIQTTTLSDELKVGTQGRGFIYSIAERREAAVIPAGHNADGAYWVNPEANCWCTSSYYTKSTPKWLETYNTFNTPYKKSGSVNEQITDLALKCISINSLGKDDSTDMLFITYNATTGIDKKGYENSKDVYLDIDRNIGKLLVNIETTIGIDKVLFVVTGTGYYTDLTVPEKKYRLPGGTLYINRTANLLNMYLGALYGSDKYIEGYYGNQIYLNSKLIDKKRLNYNEITKLAKAFIRQTQGVINVYTGDDLMSTYSPELDKLRHGYRSSNCGDIIVEVAPGWNVYNEDTHHQYDNNTTNFQTPIIFYGYNIKQDKVTAPVSCERLSPTIAKAIRIRAPNGCKESPLF